MNRDIFAMLGVIYQRQPLHDVAFDGVGEIVDGIGPVGQAKVDDCGRMCVRARFAPEKVGGVQIVVRPEWPERGQQRLEFVMKGREQIERLVAIAAGLVQFSKAVERRDIAPVLLADLARRRW